MPLTLRKGTVEERGKEEGSAQRSSTRPPLRQRLFWYLGRARTKGPTSDNKEVLYGLSSGHLDELSSGRGGSSGSNEVVDDEDGLPLLNRVLLDLEGILSILEGVGDLMAGSGKLLGLSDGHKASVEAKSEGRAARNGRER